MTQLQLLALLCITGAAASVDARTGRIPNRLVAMGGVLALVVRIGLALQAIDAGPASALVLAALEGLGGALVGLLAGSLLPVALYQARVIAGGDVKLLAVIGALIATGPALELLRNALLVAGLFGAVKLARAGRLWRALAAPVHWCKRLVTRRAQPRLEPAPAIRLPLGPPIFVAACYLTAVHWPAAETGVSAASPVPLPIAQRSSAVVNRMTTSPHDDVTHNDVTP
jgi:Flp pilus assembly protein protease CpaA